MAQTNASKRSPSELNSRVIPGRREPNSFGTNEDVLRVAFAIEIVQIHKNMTVSQQSLVNDIHRQITERVPLKRILTRELPRTWCNSNLKEWYPDIEWESMKGSSKRGNGKFKYNRKEFHVDAYTSVEVHFVYVPATIPTQVGSVEGWEVYAYKFVSMKPRVAEPDPSNCASGPADPTVNATEEQGHMLSAPLSPQSPVLQTGPSDAMQRIHSFHLNDVNARYFAGIDDTKRQPTKTRSAAANAQSSAVSKIPASALISGSSSSSSNWMVAPQHGLSIASPQPDLHVVSRLVRTPQGLVHPFPPNLDTHVLHAVGSSSLAKHAAVPVEGEVPVVHEAETKLGVGNSAPLERTSLVPDHTAGWSSPAHPHTPEGREAGDITIQSPASARQTAVAQHAAVYHTATASAVRGGAAADLTTVDGGAAMPTDASVNRMDIASADGSSKREPSLRIEIPQPPVVRKLSDLSTASLLSSSKATAPVNTSEESAPNSRFTPAKWDEVEAVIRAQDGDGESHPLLHLSATEWEALQMTRINARTVDDVTFKALCLKHVAEYPSWTENGGQIEPVNNCNAHDQGSADGREESEEATEADAMQCDTASSNYDPNAAHSQPRPGAPASTRPLPMRRSSRTQAQNAAAPPDNSPTSVAGLLGEGGDAVPSTSAPTDSSSEKPQPPPPPTNKKKRKKSKKQGRKVSKSQDSDADSEGSSESNASDNGRDNGNGGDDDNDGGGGSGDGGSGGSEGRAPRGEGGDGRRSDGGADRDGRDTTENGRRDGDASSHGHSHAAQASSSPSEETCDNDAWTTNWSSSISRAQYLSDTTYFCPFGGAISSGDVVAEDEDVLYSYSHLTVGFGVSEDEGEVMCVRHTPLRSTHYRGLVKGGALAVWTPNADGEPTVIAPPAPSSTASESTKRVSIEEWLTSIYGAARGTLPRSTASDKAGKGIEIVVVVSEFAKYAPGYYYYYRPSATVNGNLDPVEPAAQPQVDPLLAAIEEAYHVDMASQRVASPVDGSTTGESSSDDEATHNSRAPAMATGAVLPNAASQRVAESAELVAPAAAPEPASPSTTPHGQLPPAEATDVEDSVTNCGSAPSGLIAPVCAVDSSLSADDWQNTADAELVEAHGKEHKQEDCTGDCRIDSHIMEEKPQPEVQQPREPEQCCGQSCSDLVLVEEVVPRDLYTIEPVNQQDACQTCSSVVGVTPFTELCIDLRNSAVKSLLSEVAQSEKARLVLAKISLDRCQDLPSAALQSLVMELTVKVKEEKCIEIFRDAVTGPVEQIQNAAQQEELAAADPHLAQLCEQPHMQQSVYYVTDDEVYYVINAANATAEAVGLGSAVTNDSIDRSVSSTATEGSAVNDTAQTFASSTPRTAARTPSTPPTRIFTRVCSALTTALNNAASPLTSALPSVSPSDPLLSVSAPLGAMVGAYISVRDIFSGRWPNNHHPWR